MRVRFRRDVPPALAVINDDVGHNIGEIAHTRRQFRPDHISRGKPRLAGARYPEFHEKLVGS
jgi:hypothetical protein